MTATLQLDDPKTKLYAPLKIKAEAPKAAALHKAGVRFAFTSGTLTRPADYLSASGLRNEGVSPRTPP